MANENGNIDNLRIEISASSARASNSIKKLAEQLSELKNVLRGESGETAGKLTQLASALNKLKDAGNISIGNKLPEQLRNLSSAVSEVSGETIRKLDEMTAAIERLKGIDLGGFANAAKAAQKTAGQVSALSSVQAGTLTQTSPLTDKDIAKMVAVDFGPAQTAQKSFSEIAAIVWGKVNPALKVMANALKSAASHAARMAKSFLSFAGKTLKNIWDKSAFKGLEKSLSRIKSIVSSFGRIAFYRLIRSAIKYVTEALKEGTENAYHYAQEFGNATHYIAEAYDEMASGSFKMKNQMGAAWSTLIAAIEPVIMRIINLVTKAMNAITQLFALLSGKGTYLKAVDYNKQWADSASGAASAAKEWKNQLLGFDEINRLEEPSSGSGGGGSGLADYENMFEESPISRFFEEIKESFESGKWAELGSLLGNKVNDLVNSVKWEEVGKKFGKKLAGVIEIGYSFLKTVDFQNIGASIADFFNGALDSINFEEAGRLMVRMRLILWDVLYGAIVELDWGQLATSLSDFVLGALNELNEWLRGLDPGEIAQAIKDFIGNIKKDEIKEAFKNVLKASFELAIGLVTELFPDGLIPSLAKGIAQFVTDAISALKDSDFQEAHNIFSYKIDKALFGEKWANMWWGHGEYAGSEIIRGLIDGYETNTADLDNALDSGKHTFAEFGDESTEKIKKSSTSLRNMADEGSSAMAELETAVQDSGGNIITILQEMKQEAQGFANSLSGSNTETGFSTDDMSVSGSSVSVGGFDSVIAKLQEMADQAKVTQEAYTELSVSLNETAEAIDAVFVKLYDGWSARNEEMIAGIAELNEAFDEHRVTVGDVVADNLASFTELVNGFEEARTIIIAGITQMKTAMGNLERVWYASTYNMTIYILDFASYTLTAAKYVIEAMNLMAKAALRTAMTMMFLVMVMSMAGFGGGGSVSTNSISVPQYASGGFPEDGLFMANHGEMVGQFSNGKTAVANNAEIVAGISEGVYDAVMAALANSESKSQGNRDIVLNVNGREFARATYYDQQAVASEHGKSVIINA